MGSDMIKKTREELIEIIDQLNKKLDARDSKPSRDIDDKDGRSTKKRQAANDITERKQAEEALRESEQQLEGIINSVTDHMSMVDEHHNIVWTNDVGKRLFGPNLIGKKCYAAYHRRDKVCNSCIVTKTFADGKIHEHETEVIGADGKKMVFWCTANVAARYEDGRPRLVVEISRDITKRKKIEEAIQESEERYHSLSEAAFEAIFISEKGVCLEQNSTAEKMFGYALSEAIGRKGTEWIAPEDREMVMNNMLSGYEEPYEATALRKNGSTFPTEIQGKMMHHKGRTVRVTALSDITKHKQTEEKLKNALVELQKLKEQIEKENIYLQEEIRLHHNFGEIIGQSNSLKKMFNQVELVSKTDTSVLILGETGTGKELVARAIHGLSKRKDRPLVKVNCSALPKELIESELFGHVKGAFTGAIERKIGRFELADKGTIFLDEIVDLPLNLQSRLLRVLQENEFERIGSSTTIKVDVRVIAATNRNMEKLVLDGEFRQDLYYRLNVFPITCPSLRKRNDDIPFLVNHFVNKYGPKMGKRIKTIPQNVIKNLQNYHWPGNVRELENVIERAMVINQGNQFHIGDWFIQSPLALESMAIPSLREYEKDYIIHVLEKTNWRIRGKNGAAQILGLKPTTLESKMQRLEIKR